MSIQCLEQFRADFVNTFEGQFFGTEKLELLGWQVLGIVGSIF